MNTNRCLQMSYCQCHPRSPAITRELRTVALVSLITIIGVWKTNNHTKKKQNKTKRERGERGERRGGRAHQRSAHGRRTNNNNEQARIYMGGGTVIARKMRFGSSFLVSGDFCFWKQRWVYITATLRIVFIGFCLEICLGWKLEANQRKGAEAKINNDTN